VTEREIADRLLGVCRLADRLRPPGHRNTAEDYVAERDEIRDQARRLYKDITGTWPSHDAGGPPHRAAPQVPAAVLRHRERVKSGRLIRA